MLTTTNTSGVIQVCKCGRTGTAALTAHKCRKASRQVIAASLIGAGLILGTASGASAHCTDKSSEVADDGDTEGCATTTTTARTTTTATPTSTTIRVTTSAGTTTVASTSTTAATPTTIDTAVTGPTTSVLGVIDEAHPVAPGADADPTTTTARLTGVNELPATGLDYGRWIVIAGLVCFIIGSLALGIAQADEATK